MKFLLAKTMLPLALLPLAALPLSASAGSAIGVTMAHFDALHNGTPVRTTVDDGLKALDLAEAATLSWKEDRIVEL